eukprot:CAMPEP_0172208182 /NCGR_PEP_ID=MMETSP1050-20130122/34314_1 /TAXON_ID=233186 /ORGANISM="Cryptomonas curvata, Strain CCAP979/52" /LENGTH=336 /DNA_ID=CAMNT_0012887713 /DNA_START=587 /DNA_END=1594 /DNA_ORIENTATION=-
MGSVSNRRQGRMPVHLAVSITRKVDGAHLANEWHASLSRLTNGSTHVYAASSKKLIVQTADAAAGFVLPWIAQQRETSWVEAREVMPRAAKGIIQSGNSSFTPLHDRGIRGAGVVVGIADTGIDHKLCYFHDPQRAVPFNRVDQSHRKIIAYKYRAGVGNTRDEEGHGTHTSGSIAGNALAGGEQGQFDGTAPAAKLYFDDIFMDDNLSPPDDLEVELFPEPFYNGAKIRTESWGGDSIFYTMSALETDAFAHAHREFLMLWAAGNEGDRGAFTIGSPATGKNQLAVGAQHSSLESLAAQESDTAFLHLSAPGQVGLSVTAKWAAFGSRAEITAAV